MYYCRWVVVRLSNGVVARSLTFPQGTAVEEQPDDMSWKSRLEKKSHGIPRFHLRLPSERTAFFEQEARPKFGYPIDAYLSPIATILVGQPLQRYMALAPKIASCNLSTPLVGEGCLAENKILTFAKLEKGIFFFQKFTATIKFEVTIQLKKESVVLAKDIPSTWPSFEDRYHGERQRNGRCSFRSNNRAASTNLQLLQQRQRPRQIHMHQHQHAWSLD
ncbi:hypothetical protein FN846DRAFT_290138 [Sphaerosporella brunnea]|uniref:Uncharacterized protein n=1 Tax=Sphaerosporella brunnea TaxID=1250544 RepID=A0A5J5ELN5_9PEZI|nr:hypothetical protein FN846DRAFT_290138 [Sphaerosporella brunnea]